MTFYKLLRANYGKLNIQLSKYSLNIDIGPPEQ